MRRLVCPLLFTLDAFIAWTGYRKWDDARKRPMKNWTAPTQTIPDNREAHIKTTPSYGTAGLRHTNL